MQFGQSELALEMQPAEHIRAAALASGGISGSRVLDLRRECRAGLQRGRYGPSRFGLAIAMALLPLSAVRAAEPVGTLKIDESSSVTFSVEARDIPVADVMKDLAERLHFQVEGLAAPGLQQKISGSYKGDLDAILRRLLGDKGFVMWSRNETVERVVVIGTASTANLATPTTADVMTPDRAVAPYLLNSFGAPPSGAPAIAGADTSGGPNPINSIMRTQLQAQQQTNLSTTAMSATAAITGTSSTSSPDPDAASMSVITRSAQQNVQALAAALRSVCIGARCSR